MKFPFFFKQGSTSLDFQKFYITTKTDMVFQMQDLNGHKKDGRFVSHIHDFVSALIHDLLCKHLRGERDGERR